MKRSKWLLIPAAVLLAAIVAVVCFWDTLAVYIAPKTVLSGALQTAVEQLQQRYEQSPLSLLAGRIDPGGLYDADMELVTENKLLGQVSYHMSVSADTVNNRILAEGTVQTAQNDLDLTLYLDKSFMALSSRDLLEGAYYGITYDSFPEDIRRIPLISMFIGEKILSGWDDSVESIQSLMNQSYTLPELPEISQEDIRQAITAIMLLPGQVERVKMPVLGVYADGYRIDYSASGEQVATALSSLMEIGDGSNARIHASFYLYEKQLVMMVINGGAGGNTFRCALELMYEADSITIRLSHSGDGEEEGICIRHKVESADGAIKEVWSVYPNFEGTGENTRVAYRWEPSVGLMTFDGDSGASVFIRETEAGLRLQTEDLPLLMDTLSGKDPDPERKPISCSVLLRSGQGVATPDYKNLSQWSLEDLLVLLGGIGGLFGLDTR